MSRGIDEEDFIEEDAFDAKVRELLAPLGRERLERLSPVQTPEEVVARIADAFAEDRPLEVGYDIGFHMADWNSDAAFVVALLLFPERFSPAEINEGILGFLTHAPNHIAAAAKLLGHPVKDIFGVGALDNGNRVKEEPEKAKEE